MKRLILLTLLLMSSHLFAGEADVIAVDIQPLSSNEYRISVTLQHADTGWDHYANAWEVLDGQGKVIGERVLYHPHVNEQPFTRSLTLRLPAGLKEITIRAKDSVHAYGGKTMTVAVPVSK